MALIVSACNLPAVTSVGAQVVANQLLEPGPLEDLRPFRVLDEFGPEDYLYKPSGLAFGRESELYVLDSGNNRVVVFSSDGVFVRSFGRFGDAPGEFRASPGSEDDIAVEDDTVAVLEVLRRRVQLFDASGEYLRGFTESRVVKGVALRGSQVYLGVTPAGAETPSVLVAELSGVVTREMGEPAILAPRRFLDSRRLDISANGGILQAFWVLPLLRVLDNGSHSDRWYDFSWWEEPELAAWYTRFNRSAFESLQNAYSTATSARRGSAEPALPGRVVFSDIACARRAPACALARSVHRQERTMSKQFRLFGPQEATGTASLWERIDPETRNEVLSILAEMARDSLHAGAKQPSKERTDER